MLTDTLMPTESTTPKVKENKEIASLQLQYFHDTHQSTQNISQYYEFNQKGFSIAHQI